MEPDQVRVLGQLRASGCEVYVWRPDDLDVAHAAFRARPAASWTPEEQR